MGTIVIQDDDSTVVITEGTGTGGLTGDVAAERAARIAADALLIPLAQKGVADGVATLDGSGLVPVSELPPLQLGQTFVANSEAEMLALTAGLGDTCIRTDLNPDGFFILLALPASTLANWNQIVASGTVQSVDGRTGTVSLTDRYDPLGAYLGAPVEFGKAGTVAVAVGKARWPAPAPLTLTRVIAVVDTAPVGADMVFALQAHRAAGDVSIPVTILDGANEGTATASVQLAANDYLTFDVIQTGVSGGGTIAGWDLTVQVLFGALTGGLTDEVAVRTVTDANTTLNDADDVVLMNSADPHTVTLHDATTAASKWFTVKNIGVGDVTVLAAAGQTIDGLTSYGPLATNQLIDFLPDGTTDWKSF